jgi:hypothetical protein
VLRVLFTDGGIIDRTQEDRFVGLGRSVCRFESQVYGLTAYAIRSPLGSEDRGVGWPLFVVGDAAQMASGEGKPGVRFGCGVLATRDE